MLISHSDNEVGLNIRGGKSLIHRGKKRQKWEKNLSFDLSILKKELKQVLSLNCKWKFMESYNPHCVMVQKSS